MRRLAAARCAGGTRLMNFWASVSGAPLRKLMTNSCTGRGCGSVGVCGRVRDKTGQDVEGSEGMCGVPWR
eukprot:365588-Chlamydomonas_euryale.AAC.2